MRLFAIAIASALLMAACSGQDGGLTAEQQAQAQSLYEKYEAARQGGNWEAAEAQAASLRKRFPDSEWAVRLDASLANTRLQAERVREQRRLRDLWDYQEVAVDGGIQRTATIFSRTVPVGEGELPPPADAQLVLRDHPSWGRSAYLLLAQSKFDCGQPCEMTIAFDDGAVERYAGKQADSGKGPALFIEDEARFVAELARAQRVRIALPKGSGLVSSVSFEVGGFDPARYARP